ncbi:MAG: sigma-70 family RNA polymerase sigma factor [Bacilli bacterium]|nr:sigma-70 family RNA polymerase sigma factor [Bacilli bacterium]
MKQLTDLEFTRVFDQYFKELFNIAYGYTHDSFDAEDIVQEVFIKFYQTHKTCNDDNDKYWLIRLTINKSLDFLRKKKNAKALTSSEYIDNLPDSYRNNDNDDIYECVNLLNKSYKTIIVFRYFNNYSVKEIARILKISESNATTRLSRAKIKLKEIIVKRRASDGR